MANADFELYFERMGLRAMPPGVSCDATFAPGSHDDTLASGPRAEVTALDASMGGTLPRLVLATPDAAREDSADETELIPVGVIGEGGMGRVLLARQHSLGREVAVKVLKANANNAGAAAALVEEARTTGSLEHPGVVPVYALARDGNGLPALVMKRVDGVSWRELIHDEHHPAWKTVATGRDPLEGNLEILIQVCNAVAYAHRRGVIHRDLKPANVLVGELGEVYVADWGVAIQKAGLRPGPPRLIGTPAYLAPEMATGDAALMDERTDVYLLGGALHEVLTHQPTHKGTDLRDVLEKAWLSTPPVFKPEVSAELAAICTRALAADPKQRFQTVLALRDALRQFIVHRGATRLTDAAAARLARLEAMVGTKPTDAEARGWYALVSECRFGFSSALETHPDDLAARAGLERLLSVGARTELQRGQASSARGFLSEMKAPPPELEQAVQRIEAQDRERLARASKLEQLEHELNPEISSRQRTVLYLMLSATIGGLILFFGTDSEQFPKTVGRWGRMVPIAILMTVYGVCLIVGRKALFSTRINRQLMAVVALGCVGLQLNRATCVLLNVPVEGSMAIDGIILSVILFMCAVMLHAWFIGPALLCLVGTAISVTWPEHAIKAFAFSSLISFVLAAFLYRGMQKNAARAREVR
jgi:hypothetical protein